MTNDRQKCYGFGMDEMNEQFFGNERNKQELIKKWCNVNVLLIAVNVGIWLGLSIFGDTTNAMYMREHGAMYPQDVQNGEWYRLFSALFLHFGIEHLLSNMFMQYFLGDMILRAIQQWKYLLVYIVSGLGGSVASLVMMQLTSDVAVAAGASGAIYGIIGALLWIVLRNRGTFEDISIPRMLLATVAYISYGFTTEGVDAWAHLGGALIGFLLSILLYRKPKERSS